MIFDEFYFLNFDKIFRYILRRTGDYNESLDILQEIFFKIFLKFENFQKMDEKAKTSYLFKIANSTIIDFFRKNGKRKSISLDFDAGENNLETLEISIDAKKMIEIIKKLPSIYQEILILKYVEEMENSEIAKIVGKRESSIRSLTSRGLKKLEALEI